VSTGQNTEFHGLIQDFPVLLKRLRHDTYPAGAFRKPPEKGVYAFRVGEVTWYVGRTDRMAGRWADHTRDGSDDHKASFAFLLAKEAAEKAHIHARSRKALARDGRFKRYFRKAKADIRRMSRHAVEVTDPRRQALFEIYAAVALRAMHVDLRNH
jgi:predicted GIY-YIG superfamily endonuclease